MTIFRSTIFLLLLLSALAMDAKASESTRIPEHLRHDIQEAEQLFRKRCTECHSMEAALSSRAYRDWRLGISHRHGKGSGWISDEEAELIFIHLVVHLEPNLEPDIQAKEMEPKENWKILICLITGFSTLALLVTTVIFGHNKKLRRKWFKGHGFFAVATLAAAIIHGGYCSYVFFFN